MNPFLRMPGPILYLGGSPRQVTHIFIFRHLKEMQLTQESEFPLSVQLELEHLSLSRHNHLLDLAQLSNSICGTGMMGLAEQGAAH